MSDMFDQDGVLRQRLLDHVKTVPGHDDVFMVDQAQVVDVIARQILRDEHVVTHESGPRRKVSTGRYVPTTLANGKNADAHLTALVDTVSTEVAEFITEVLSPMPGCRRALVATTDDEGKKHLEEEENRRWTMSVDAFVRMDMGFRRILRDEVRGRMMHLVGAEIGLVSRAPKVEWPVIVPFEDVIYEIGDWPTADALMASRMANGDWHSVRPYRHSDTVYRVVPHRFMDTVPDDWDGEADVVDVPGEEAMVVHSLPHVADGGGELYRLVLKYTSGEPYVWEGDTAGEKPRDMKTYNTILPLLDLLGEGFVHRKKQYGLMICGQPGGGKSMFVDMLRAIWGSDQVDGTLGADSHEPGKMFNESGVHPTINDIFNGTTMVFTSDFGRDFTLGSKTQNVIAPSGKIGYRGMHENYDRNIEIGCLIVLEINSPAGLTGSSASPEPDERRLMQVMLPKINYTDRVALDRMRSETVGPGQLPVSVGSFIRLLLMRIERHTVLYAHDGHAERAPFREAIDDGFFEPARLSENYSESLGLEPCEWGFDEDGIPYGMLSVTKMTDILAKIHGVVMKRGALTDFFDTMSLGGSGVLLKGMGTIGEYRSSERVSKTHVAVGWKCSTLGSSVSIAGKVDHLKLRKRLAEMTVANLADEEL